MSTDQQVQPTFTADDVRAVTGDVWESCLHSCGDLLEWGSGEPMEGEVAQALIHIAGEWSGAVTLEMSVETAQTAARVMLDTAEVEPDEVTDAVGELVNIIGGNIKSLLPTPSTLSLPQVVRRGGDTGPAAVGAEPLVQPVTELCRVDLSWGARPILVRVWA